MTRERASRRSGLSASPVPPFLAGPGTSGTAAGAGPDEPARPGRRRRAGTVAEEIRQVRPFRSPAQEALLGVLLTADRLSSLLTETLARESELTSQQYNVLRILRGAGGDGLPTLAIVERMIERAPGITRLLDRLEHKGLIQRVREAGDRRQVLCRATPEGLALLARLDPVIDRLDDLPLARMSAAELEKLVKGLDRLRAALA